MRTPITTIAWILLVLTTIVMIDCSDEDSVLESTPSKQVIMPLATGNTWTYVDSVWWGSNTPYELQSTLVVTGQTSVTIDTTVYDVYTMSLQDPIFMLTTELYLRNEADGLWQLGVKCPNSTELQRSMYFMYPGTTGDVWIKNWIVCSGGDPSSNGMDSVTVMSTNHAVDTPLGLFSCYRYLEQYDTPFGRFEIEQFVAPDVGIIATNMAVMGFIIKRRLSSYDLN